jgi:hypothetical protein
MILIVNADYFVSQHQAADLCNGDASSFLGGTDRIFK